MKLKKIYDNFDSKWKIYGVKKAKALKKKCGTRQKRKEKHTEI